MRETQVFYPPQRKGTILHVILIALFTGLGAWAIVKINQAQVTPQLIPYLAFLLAFLTAAPLLIYRLYALHRAYYLLNRGGMHLQWGWRQVTVPFQEINWVYPAEDLHNPPRPPLFSWSGAVLGIRKPGSSSTVEFIASRKKDLIVISAEGRYFVISPQDPDKFQQTVSRLMELGSLEAVPAQSIRPSLMFSTLREEKIVLIELGAGLLLNLTLLSWVLLLIRNRDSVSLGFSPAGVPYPALESIRLILLPILNFTSYLTNFLLGLFLYRKPENKPFAYLLWGGSVIIAVLFHLGLYYAA